MSRADMTEEEAKVIFAEQVNALAEHARLYGPDPDCARRIAEIIAENEAECLRMEREAAANEAAEDAYRRATGT